MIFPIHLNNSGYRTKKWPGFCRYVFTLPVGEAKEIQKANVQKNTAGVAGTLIFESLAFLRCVFRLRLLSLSEPVGLLFVAPAGYAIENLLFVSDACLHVSFWCFPEVGWLHPALAAPSIVFLFKFPKDVVGSSQMSHEWKIKMR